MSNTTQIGLIILPANTEELNEILAKLQGANVAVKAVSAPVKTTKAPVVEEEPEVETETLPAVDAATVKAVMTQVRDEKGEEAITELLTAFGATQLKDVSKDDWSALVAAAKTLLTDGASDEDDGFGLDDEDDGFGLDDDDAAPDVDAETVKTSVQAYAKKNGKEKAQALLAKHGLNTVRGLASADAKTLGAIYAVSNKG